MNTISFAGDGLAPELLPVEELADCAATALEGDGNRILSYGTGAGYTPLRELLGELIGVHPFRIVLTNGWLQGFAMLAQERARGSNVIIEYPSYDKVLGMIFPMGANLVYLDRHDDGYGLDQVEYAIRTTQNVAFVYIMPTFQNPTGLTLPDDQRTALHSLLGRARERLLVIENDSLSLLRFEGERQPTIFQLSGQTTVYSTSFSYTIAPGLRVGVFVLPENLAGELATQANGTYITPSLLGQATVFEYLRRGSFEPNLERLNAALKERRDTLLGAIDAHLEDVTATRPEGGIFVLLRLPAGANAKHILAHADGVAADAGLDIFGAPNTIRLNFASPALDEIEPGIERLARAINEAPPAPEGFG